MMERLSKTDDWPTGISGWQILDDIPLPCLVVNRRAGAVTFSNQAAKLNGLVQQSLLGEIETFVSSTTPETRELATQGPNGKQVYQVFSRPLTREAPPQLVVLVLQEITQMKLAEEQLLSALEARDEFLSIATHELKDPLFSLQLSIQLLRHSAKKLGDIPVHIQQHLEISERQAARLGLLIDNLLDVARIINRKLALEIEAFDLSHLARETVDRFQGRAEAAGTKLAVEADEPLIGHFDRLKLEQVLGNLLANAIKYGAGKPVQVRVREEGESAVLEVADRGAGIAPEDQERIFRRFERASGRHHRESLGLGLYIVRSIVEAHGGSIGLSSKPGEGTTFTVVLPRSRPTSDGPDKSEG